MQISLALEINILKTESHPTRVKLRSRRHLKTQMYFKYMQTKRDKQNQENENNQHLYFLKVLRSSLNIYILESTC